MITLTVWTAGVLLVIVLVVAFFLRHILGGMFGLYRIVPVNEAHIRILRNTKSIFSAREGKSAYWMIPFITKLHKLPLCNLAIPVNDIKLNDKAMAKFVSDIMCFINIKNIDLAVERLILTDATKEMGFDFVKLSEDLRAIMESVGRTVTTKQSILDIYMNRQLLDAAITKHDSAKAVAGMLKLREAIDALEGITPANLWPVPSYAEMLLMNA